MWSWISLLQEQRPNKLNDQPVVPTALLFVEIYKTLAILQRDWDLEMFWLKIQFKAKIYYSALGSIKLMRKQQNRHCCKYSISSSCSCCRSCCCCCCCCWIVCSSSSNKANKLATTRTVWKSGNKCSGICSKTEMGTADHLVRTFDHTGRALSGQTGPTAQNICPSETFVPWSMKASKGYNTKISVETRIARVLSTLDPSRF